LYSESKLDFTKIVNGLWSLSEWRKVLTLKSFKIKINMTSSKKLEKKH